MTSSPTPQPDAADADNEIATWRASDGTTWVQHPTLGEWSGWENGEDGCWHLDDEEFYRWYPDAPRVGPH